MDVDPGPPEAFGPEVGAADVIGTDAALAVVGIEVAVLAPGLVAAGVDPMYVRFSPADLQCFLDSTLANLATKS